MKSARRLLCAAVALGCVPAIWAVTPAQQVINMLTQMKTNGAKMRKDEEKVFATYKAWASLQSVTLAFDIESGGRKIDELAAFITKADSDVAALGEQIRALSAELEQLSAEKKQATDVRAQEYADFTKTSEDYFESIHALKEAVRVLSGQDYDRAQATALLERLSGTMPGMPRVIAAFMQIGEEPAPAKAALDHHAESWKEPEVAAYQFQSGVVLKMIEGLLEKFDSELKAAEREETNQAHSFSMLELHLTNTITADTADREEKAALKGKRKAAGARAKGQLAEVEAEKAKDEELKTNIETNFQVKQATFETNQALRTGELETLAKAIEVLQSPEVADYYAKHLALEQASRQDKPVSFLQLGSARRNLATVAQAAALLRRKAQALRSTTLAALATQVAANPFEKVVTMIETLLAKLKADAIAEAEHHAWCDQQLKENERKRRGKAAQINRLTADIETMDISIIDLGAAIKVLAKEQAELAQAMADATSLRQTEKVENEATIKDAKAGFQAVARASAILRDFYATQGSPSGAFLQQVPEMAAYTGMHGPATKGVVGMLEVIQSDFARLRDETETAEKESDTAYRSYMTESEGTQKVKRDREFKLSLDKDQVEYERSEASKDLVATQEELDSANEYYASLRSSCVLADVSWDERVKLRKEEIAALNEAYAILDKHPPAEAES